MAPVEIDHVPRSIIAPVKNMKVVDKAMSLPLVSSACSELSLVTSPIMESTYNRVSPVVENTLEMVTPVMDSVKTKVEEQVFPHIPVKITKTVQNYQEVTVDKDIAAVEKVDTIACGGIDQLKEKVPQLKEATPKLMEETKSSVTVFVTRWSQYLASFSVVPLLALKVVDVSLERVEETLKTTSSLVQMARTTVISLRHGAARSAGTPLAKKIDELSLTGALGEVTGLNGLMERLGLAGNVSEATSAEEIQSEATGGVDTKKLEKAQKRKEKMKEKEKLAREAKKAKTDAEKGEKEKSPATPIEMHEKYGTGATLPLIPEIVSQTSFVSEATSAEEIQSEAVSDVKEVTQAQAVAAAADGNQQPQVAQGATGGVDTKKLEKAQKRKEKMKEKKKLAREAKKVEADAEKGEKEKEKSPATPIEMHDKSSTGALPLMPEVVSKTSFIPEPTSRSPAMVVISSMGGASLSVGGVLGQYEYDEMKGYYQQTSTEKGHEDFRARYLYPDEDDKWHVDHTPYIYHGEKGGYLYNPIPSKTPPTSGWQCAKKGTLLHDPTLTISTGPLPPLARQLTVTATGAAADKYPSCLGVFSRSERWWNGRPVYTNIRGRFLYHHGVGYGWVIGYKFDRRALAGSRSYHSPESEDRWRYWTGSEWKPASATVTASSTSIRSYSVNY